MQGISTGKLFVCKTVRLGIHPHTSDENELAVHHRPECKVRNALQEVVSTHLLALGLGDEWLGSTPKAQFIKEKIDRLPFIEIKNFSFSLRNS